MTFVHHYIGAWVRTNDWANPVIEEATVNEYRTLDEVPEPERKVFAWMLDEGQLCVSSGMNVYQIREEH